jgi:hypothetical protein
MWFQTRRSSNDDIFIWQNLTEGREFNLETHAVFLEYDRTSPGETNIRLEQPKWLHHSLTDYWWWWWWWWWWW